MDDWKKQLFGIASDGTPWNYETGSVQARVVAYVEELIEKAEKQAKIEVLELLKETAKTWHKDDLEESVSIRQIDLLILELQKDGQRQGKTKTD